MLVVVVEVAEAKRNTADADLNVDVLGDTCGDSSLKSVLSCWSTSLETSVECGRRIRRGVSMRHWTLLPMWCRVGDCIGWSVSVIRSDTRNCQSDEMLFISEKVASFG